MKTTLGALLLLSAAACGSIAAAPCDTTALSKLVVTSDVRTCRADSGYSPTSMTAPTDAQVDEVCNSEACTRALDSVKQVAPNECTVGTVRLYANVIDPLERRCGRNSGSVGSAAMSGNASGSGPAAGDVGSQPAGDSPTTTPRPSPRSDTPSPAPANNGANPPTLSKFTAVAVLAAVVAAIL